MYLLPISHPDCVMAISMYCTYNTQTMLYILVIMGQFPVYAAITLLFVGANAAFNPTCKWNNMFNMPLIISLRS
jgi:hypothetical protein